MYGVRFQADKDVQICQFHMGQVGQDGLAAFSHITRWQSQQSPQRHPHVPPVLCSLPYN